jgi:hypothetical protein
MHRDALGAGIGEDRLVVLFLLRQVQAADVDLEERELVAHAGAVQHELGHAVRQRDLVIDLHVLDFHRARRGPCRAAGHQQDGEKDFHY